MGEDPRFVIFSTFVRRAAHAGVGRVTFDRGEVGTDFRVCFDGQELSLATSPSGMFAGIRYWATELSGLRHDQDEEQTGHIHIPDCNNAAFGGPFGCYAGVDATVKVDAQRVEIEVLRVDDHDFTAQPAPYPYRPLATHFDVRNFIDIGDDEMAVSLLTEYASREGADINARDNDRKTMLMLAASYGRLSVATMLLQLGADPTLRDALNETAFDKAAQRGKTDVAELLRSLGTQ
jgi:hypothetical protein